MVAIELTKGVFKEFDGDYTTPDKNEHITKTKSNQIMFEVIGASKSIIEFDVDGKHDAYGNSITLSNGTNKGWKYPNEEMVIKIWSIDKLETYCDPPQYMVSSYTKGHKCKSRGCKQSAYTEYTPLDVISMSSLCKTCKNTGGTGYTVDKNCKMIATAGYIIKNGEAMKRGCTNSKYDEYESGALP